MGSRGCNKECRIDYVDLQPGHPEKKLGATFRVMFIGG